MLFGVLGPVAVWTAGGQPVTVPGRKVRALLAVLVLHEGRPVTAARLIDDLWGERLPGNPAGTLSAKVSGLRRALELAEPGGRRLVASPPPGYRLRIEPDAVDACRFRALTARARRSRDARTRVELLAEALALWRGPALAEFEQEPFAAVAAAGLNEERLLAIEDHAEARLAAGEHTELVTELTELLAAHPLRERLRAVHMLALYRCGRPGAALASYGELRVRLANELGLDPAPDIVALHGAVLARDPALDAVPTRTRERTNLPAALTELVGRGDAVTAIRARLRTDRLVTLTGPGGVGKTRLALETAAGLADAFDDGVWVAELAALEAGSTGDAAGVVMAALDVRDVMGDRRPSAERLADAVSTRRLLLVLDNCEHLVDEAAELAGRLLRAAPGLRILATSREPLGLPGEVVWSVPPLDVPEPTAGADPAELDRSSAVRLFVARASAAAPGFALDPDTAGAVAVLCRRLDGIPLALELAATRVRGLGVAELVARLDDRFRLLSDGRRDTPARQRTLAAMIDWSWGLLTEPDRMLLRRLAVHVDGCTMEAAAQVCAEDGLDVAERLPRLVDRSLVAVHGSGSPRYRLLESVAAYCAARLDDAGEAELIGERHGRYYTELAERAADGLHARDQRDWLRRLDVESANMRSALDRALKRGDATLALRLVCALTWYWFLRGRITDAGRALHAALQVDGDAPAGLGARAAAWQAGIQLVSGDRRAPVTTASWEQLDDPAARGRAEWFVAYAETDFGDVQAVDERLERALTAAHDADDTWGVAAVLSTRAKLGFVRGDLSGLERDGERSAGIFRELGERWGLMQATAWLGGLAETLGDLGKATRLQAEGLRMAEELGLWPEVAVRMAWLAWLVMLQGDYDGAYEQGEQAHRLAREQSLRVGEILAELALAFAARRKGDLDRAEKHLTNLLHAAGSREGGRPPALHLALALTELGFVAEQRGQLTEAKRLHLDAADAAAALGQRRRVALALVGLAGVAGSADQHETCAQLLGAADALHRAAAVPVVPTELVEIERIAAAGRMALGGERFDAAYAQGAALSPEDALALSPDAPTSTCAREAGDDCK